MHDPSDQDDRPQPPKGRTPLPPEMDGLLPLVYDDLRRLAARHLRRERNGHTLQTTALAHEAYIRLKHQTSQEWRTRTEFLSAAAGMVRRILVDHARSRKTAKRGGGWLRVAFEPLAPGTGDGVDLMELEAALTQLAELHARQARVVELRFFGGLNGDEAADVLGVSPRTVDNDWRIARAWLHARLSDESETGGG